MRSAFTYTGIRGRDMDRSVRLCTGGRGLEPRCRRKVPRTGGENADLASPGSDRVLELNWDPRKGMVKEYRKGDEMAHMAFGMESVTNAIEPLARVRHGLHAEG